MLVAKSKMSQGPAVMHFVYLCLVSSMIPVAYSDDIETNHIGVNEREETLEQFRNFIRQARRTDGIIDPNIIIQQSIVDPVPISDFNISSSGVFTNIQGHFTNVTLYGLKNFEVRKIEVNLSKMNLSAEMFVPSLSVMGQYVLSGRLTFMQISGDGEFWMNLTGIDIHGQAPFHSTEEALLEMGEIILRSDISDISLHFENLMGGGVWSTVSNSLLNQLSELILDELKHSLLKELSVFLRQQFNDNLFKSLPPGFLDPKTENVVDSILQRTGEVMVNRNLDPLPMPNMTKKFERNLMFITTRGELNLTNGYLYGLSSLSRRGDVKLVFANHSVNFDADFGFDNLTATYEWAAKVFGIGPEGSLVVHVNSVDGFMMIQQQMKEGMPLDLNTFLVKNIRQIWLDIQGLGTWDYIMEIVANIATNGLKMQIADAITGPVKQNLQGEIDSLNILMS